MGVVLGLGLAFDLGGCMREPEPITAARRFASAVQRRDARAATELVQRDAVAVLERAAERATDQIGGRRRVSAQEVFQIVDVDPLFQVAAFDLVEHGEDRAVVMLRGVDGTEHSLRLVREDDGAWRVHVPVPPTVNPSSRGAS